MVCLEVVFQEMAAEIVGDAAEHAEMGGGYCLLISHYLTRRCAKHWHFTLYLYLNEPGTLPCTPAS